MQDTIYQKARLARGTPESVRVSIREKEKAFFREHILTPGGTKNIGSLETEDLTEPKQRMIEAVRVFSSGFFDDKGNVDQELLDCFVKFLLQKVVFVCVKTDTLSSGFRLFNIINTRGLSLSNADLLKSINLSEIMDEAERHRYSKIWEDIEEEIGNDETEMLISFMRHLKVQEKAERAIFDEFEKKVFVDEPDFKGKPFIEYFKEVKEIYCEKIKDANLRTGDPRRNTYFFNLVSVMRNFLPFNDWMCAVIRFKARYHNDEKLDEFVRKFEKKIAVDWIIGLSFTERLGRIFKIIKLIDNSSNAGEVLGAPILNDEVKNNGLQLEHSLNDKYFYSKARYQVPKYVLLRIDLERKYSQDVQFRYTGNIQVEHILPRTPTSQYWVERFNEIERMEWTNKLGNLALLNNRKNPQASNKPFPEKVKNYFEKVSDFEVTNDLRYYEDWSMYSLIERHKNLIAESINIWIPQ